MKHILSILVICLLAATTMTAQSIVGKWKTIDDETGKTKSVVQIYESKGKYYGKVVKLFRGADEDQNPVCEKCKDDRKGTPIKGMQVIRDLKKNGSTYSKGTIVDPESGKVYTCKVWPEGAKKLKVRGYIGFFYRTQTWHKVN